MLKHTSNSEGKAFVFSMLRWCHHTWLFCSLTSFDEEYLKRMLGLMLCGVVSLTLVRKLFSLTQERYCSCTFPIRCFIIPSSIQVGGFTGIISSGLTATISLYVENVKEIVI